MTRVPAARIARVVSRKISGWKRASKSDGSAKRGQMTSSGATHRPSQVNGELRSRQSALRLLKAGEAAQGYGSVRRGRTARPPAADADEWLGHLPARPQ